MAAARADPARFAPFPMDKYVPRRHPRRGRLRRRVPVRAFLPQGSGRRQDARRRRPRARHRRRLRGGADAPPAGSLLHHRYPGLRFRRPRWPVAPLPRDGLLRGQDARGRGARRLIERGRFAADLPPGRGRPGRRARQGHLAPRRQTRERPGPQCRRRLGSEDHRLRARRAAWTGNCRFGDPHRQQHRRHDRLRRAPNRWAACRELSRVRVRMSTASAGRAATRCSRPRPRDRSTGRPSGRKWPASSTAACRKDRKHGQRA